MIKNIAVFEWVKSDGNDFFVKKYKHDAVFLSIGNEGADAENYDTFIVMREDGSVEAHQVALCKIIESIPLLGVIIK